MKTISYLIFCLGCLLGSGSVMVHPALAQNAGAEPLINLAVKDDPLGDVLESITNDTGYRFNLNRAWEDHPVSATIVNLPLEQGLKRLLRSLNHTIVWESDKRVTIMVFGKADPSPPGSGISHAAPPQTYQEATEPTAETESASADEPEPADAGVEAAESDAASKDEVERQPADDASTPDAVKPDEPSAESAEQTQPAADAPPSGTGAQ